MLGEKDHEWLLSFRAAIGSNHPVRSVFGGFGAPCLKLTITNQQLCGSLSSIGFKSSTIAVLHIERAHVIGISMGGMVALLTAIHHPEHVEKLVLVATSAGGSAHVPPSQEMMTMLMQPDPQLEIGERVRRNYARITAPGYFETHLDDWDRAVENARYRPQRREAYFRQLQATGTYDASGHLDQIQAPTLVVHGELDPLVLPENGRYLAEHIKGAKLLLYPNTGHLLIIERAEEFNRDVLAFLES
jgi:3-oxoadipate enol-lactonase